MRINDNPFFWTDFYKFGHVHQYQRGINRIVINWTPRGTRVGGKHRVVANAGLSMFIQKTLIERFNENFFDEPLQYVLRQYKEICAQCLGQPDADTTHVEALWVLGYLPIKMFAIPEGHSVPLRVPMLVVVNTLPEFFWLPNYLETIMSSELWGTITSATTAQRFRKIMVKHAKAFYGEQADLSFVNWQGHDFSLRGMFTVEAGRTSGVAHLFSFTGSDTVPAILDAATYYNHGNLDGVGGSVPATEHSVMCAGGQDGEFDTFKRLITEVYPSGTVSVVSDTWDLWQVLTDFVPRLRAEILARPGGKLVIRPDSGDPVKIICGDTDAPEGTVQRKGVATLLNEAMGNTDGMLNGVGMIYGDAITPERCDAILAGLRAKGLSPYNMVFGLGSYTYQYVTRDTYGQAIKATATELADGTVVPIFKKPITDDGTKTSCRGVPLVYRTEESTEDRPDYFLVEGTSIESLGECAFDLVFKDGRQCNKPTLDEIRKRVQTI